MTIWSRSKDIPTPEELVEGTAEGFEKVAEYKEDELKIEVYAADDKMAKGLKMAGELLAIMGKLVGGEMSDDDALAAYVTMYTLPVIGAKIKGNKVKISKDKVAYLTLPTGSVYVGFNKKEKVLRAYFSSESGDYEYKSFERGKDGKMVPKEALKGEKAYEKSAEIELDFIKEMFS